MNTTVNKPLEQRIKDYLQQQKAGKAAAQIVKHIGHCDKKSVNAVLYQLEKQGVVTKKLQGWKPMWSLANKSWPHGWDGGFHGHPRGQWHGSYRGNHQFQGRLFPAQPIQPIQQRGPLLTDPVQGRPFPDQPHGQISHCNGPPFQGPRGRGRGRGWGGGRGGAAGRGGGRGRAHRRSSASNSPGFWCNQKTQRIPPEASSDQRGPKFGNRKFKDRASSSTGGTSAGLNGNACMGNVTNPPAPHDSVSSSSVAKQADAQQYFMNQVSALNSAVSQTGVESTMHSTTGTLDTTSTAATDVNSVGTGGALKDRGSDADTNDSLDLEDDDEMDEDSHANFETSAFTTRFQDMMGTLTFNDPVFSAEEELMEEEEPSMAWSSSDFILRLLSMAPDQAMTLTKLAEALMKPEEELASELTGCGDKVVVRDGKCSLTANGKMWAEERSENCQSVESDSKPKPEQGSSLMPAGPISPSISGPPKPPKEWIQSQTALFSSHLTLPVTKNETSTTHSGVPAEERPAMDSDPSMVLLPLMRARSFGRGQDLRAAVDRKPPPGQEGRGGITVSGSPPGQAGRGGITVSGSPPGQAGRGGITVSGSPPGQAGRGGITVSGSPPGQAGRGGITVSGSPPGQAGRGGITVSGSPPGQAGRGGITVSGSPPGQAGTGGITVSGSHDVREVESNYFSTATSQASPATSSTVTSAAAEKTGQSSSHTDSMFRTVDEIPWKPLMSSPETPVDRNIQSSVLSLSSQSSPAGQTPQGPMPWCSDTSEMPQLSSPHKSSSSGVVPMALSDVVPYTSLPDTGAVNSPSAQAEHPWMGQSPNSLHPRLQKFAAEGLTFVPASMSSVCSTEKASTCPASSGTFQKPLTPKELIELETPWRGTTSQPSGSPQSSSVLPPPGSSPSLPHSRSAPVISSVGPTSLPAWGGSEEELAGPATLQITSESFAALNKNPISALMEYAQSRHATATIEMVSQRGPSHRPVFVMAAKVGNRLFTRITCHNKKDGKKEAADVALRTLIAEGQLCPATPSPSDNIAPEDMTHFDKMAALTHQAFNALIASIPENLAGRKVIAGLVMKRNPQDLGIVVSLGTGNRCITGDKLSLEGNTVNDSHAEIITRRGFMRFLYQELLKYEEGKPHDLFERGAGGKLRVKNGVTFHLYISTAPCGDGALFSPRDTQSNSGATGDTDRREHCPTFTSSVQGLLRTKMEGGEGTIPVDSKDVTMQTWDGVVRGERLRTMSCTDKICRWNVLGLQGALLSHFLEPVYLDSLTLGFLYDHGHLSRAVCCRLAREEPRLEQELSPGFRLNHPWLGRVTACQPLREVQKTKAFSINWVIGDPAPEVLDGTVGHCYTAVEKKLFSRLTKRTLYDSFLQVAQHLGRSDLCQATSYHQAKMAATAFQTSKAAMFRKFQQMGCGWVKKPLEEEMFS